MYCSGQCSFIVPLAWLGRFLLADKEIFQICLSVTGPCDGFICLVNVNILCRATCVLLPIVCSCWISNTYAFIGALYIPMALSLIYNISIVVVITYSLRKRRKNLRTTKSDSGQASALYLSKIVFILSMILGVTWALSIFVILVNHPALEYIFTVFNSLQGVFIFVLHTLRSKDVRREWLSTVSSVIRTYRSHAASPTAPVTPKSIIIQNGVLVCRNPGPGFVSIEDLCNL